MKWTDATDPDTRIREPAPGGAHVYAVLPSKLSAARFVTVLDAISDAIPQSRWSGGIRVAAMVREEGLQWACLRVPGMVPHLTWKPPGSATEAPVAFRVIRSPAGDAQLVLHGIDVHDSDAEGAVMQAIEAARQASSESTGPAIYDVYLGVDMRLGEWLPRVLRLQQQVGASANLLLLEE